MSAQLSVGYPTTLSSNALSASAVAAALAVALLAILTFADARVDVVPVSQPAASQPVTGTFTGTYQDGLPVYRLPALEVTAQTPAVQPRP